MEPWHDGPPMDTASKRRIRLDVRRIGGIERTEVTLGPGVTALVGRNATNRTSLLQSIMAACGSTDVSVKGDADAGRVAVTVGDETDTRVLKRRGETLVASGDPLLSEPRTAELFAFLLESNPVRDAVRRGDSLRDLIMEPIDTEAIEDEIARLTRERREIEEKLDEIADLEDRLPDLRNEREEVTERIERTTRDLGTKREKLEEAGDIEEKRAERSKLDAKIDELNTKQKRLEGIHSDIDIERSAIEDVRAEIEKLEAERGRLSEAPVERMEELDREIEFVREQKREAEASMNDLQRIIQFNEEMIDGTDIELLEDRVAEADGAGSVTDQLLEGQRMICWTCGAEVGREAVESTLDRLRGVRKDELNKVNRLDERLPELETEREKLERQRQRAADIEGQLQSLREELSESERRVETLESRAKRLEADIADIEADVKRLQDETYSELLETQEQVNRLEFELEQLRDRRDDIDEEIARIETRREERDDLEPERETIQEEVVEQRTRIERTEEEAIEQFNAQMDDLLELLDYDNLERIWLEPRELSGQREGDRTFELHVVRTTESGATYEDTVAHLSESEREITGIVFALAGYLAHDVYEEVPFLLLDSLEAIDSTRIATLLGYVRGYADYVVAALLPEDASALGDEHDRVTDI